MANTVLSCNFNQIGSLTDREQYVSGSRAVCQPPGGSKFPSTDNGMTIESLRQLMGHENLNTTLVYARLADSTVEKQYETAMERVTNNQVNSVLPRQTIIR